MVDRRLRRSNRHATLAGPPISIRGPKPLGGSEPGPLRSCAARAALDLSMQVAAEKGGDLDGVPVQAREWIRRLSLATRATPARRCARRAALEGDEAGGIRDA